MTPPESLKVVNGENGTATDAPPRRRRPRAPLVLGGLVLAAALGGTGAWLLGRGKESTDDAFVEGHVTNVAARIAGQVTRVFVKDNQEVAPNAPLVELDDRDAKVRLEAAQADLEAAKAGLAAAEAHLALVERSVGASLRQARGGVTQAHAYAGTVRTTIDQARADLAAAESRRALAATNLKRARALRAEGAVPVAEVDSRQAAFDQADAALAQARARLAAAQVSVQGASGGLETASGRLLQARTGPEQIGAARAQVGVAKARVLQAQAARDQAELNRSYTTVRSPTHGVVSRRTVEVGQLVDPARPLLSVTSLNDVWVVANFKEDQLAHLRPGQRARLTVDAFPGTVLHGHVESLAGGTGARFSLLPPDNASGNFTKVVQRVPVLIRLEWPPTDLVLRPGMSAYVTVQTAR